jgi:hypothetical protein
MKIACQSEDGYGFSCIYYSAGVQEGAFLGTCMETGTCKYQIFGFNCTEVFSDGITDS